MIARELQIGDHNALLSTLRTNSLPIGRASVGIVGTPEYRNHGMRHAG